MTKANAGIHVAAAKLQFVTHAPTLWLTASFSEHWFKDAANEARGEDGQHSKRREIVFAASFLESYIFEWARELCGLVRINDYFPPTSRFESDPRFRRSLKDKWKCIPSELHADRIIAAAPSLNLTNLGKLIEFRNGLIHARASRPFTAKLKKEAQPLPAPGQLDRLRHGWACSVAKKLVLKLHNDLQTKPPNYLGFPKDA